jgi:hypothetical protein
MTAFSSLLVGKTGLRKGVVAVVAAFLVGQFYFVRELLAAELFFGLVFALLLVLGGLVYLVGSVCVRGLEFAKVGLRGIGTRIVVSATSEKLVESHPTLKGLHAPSL